MHSKLEEEDIFCPLYKKPINQPNQTCFSKECIHKNSSFTQSQILAEFVGGRGPGMTCCLYNKNI